MRGVWRLATIGALSLAAADHNGSAKEEAAVRTAISEATVAFSQGDLAKLMDLAAQEYDSRGTNGRLVRGRLEYEKALKRSFAGRAGAEKIRFTRSVEQVRFIKPDLALVDTTFEGDDVKGFSTFVLVKERGHWRVTAARHMRPPDAVAPQR